MSSVPALGLFDAISNMPIAPISNHQKWFVISGVSTLLAIALVYLGATRYLGEILNPKRFALLGGGVISGGVSIFTCRLAIQGKKDYKGKVTEYQTQKSLWESTKASLEKIINRKGPLEEGDMRCVKALSIRDQQILVASRPEFFKIIIDDLINDDEGLYLKVKAIVIGFGERDHGKIIEMFSHLMERLYIVSTNEDGTQPTKKIRLFLEALFRDWSTSDDFNGNIKFLWALQLSIIFERKKEFQGLYHEFLFELLIREKLWAKDMAQLLRELDKKLPSAFTGEDFEINWKRDNWKSFNLSNPTLLHLCIDDALLVKTVAELKPELLSQTFEVVEQSDADNKISENSKLGSHREDASKSKARITMSPRTFYLYLHPKTENQNMDILRLLPI